MQKNSDWKLKFHDLLQTCQDELKKTTIIGKKMLSASKTNSCLHDAYKELGILCAEELKKGSLNWDNSKVQELIHTIQQCEEDLEHIEAEVKNVKFSASPQDVSSKEESKDNPKN